MSDSYYDNVVLQLLCTGINNSTTFIDTSKFNRSVTRVGSTIISTVKSKDWNGSSAYFDGNIGYLQCDTSTDFNWGAGAFTIEMWVLATGTGIGGTLYSDSLEGNVAANRANRTILMFSNGSFMAEIGNAWVGCTAVNPFVWNHVAISGTGNTYRLFVNGVYQTYGATGGTTLAAQAGRPVIGISGDLTSDRFIGYIDDIRITKGISRYPTTANFIPPYPFFADSAGLPTYGKNIQGLYSKSAFQWCLLPTYEKMIDILLDKTAFQWCLLPQQGHYNNNILMSSFLQYSGLPKKITVIPECYDARQSNAIFWWGGTGSLSGTVRIGPTACKRKIRLYESVTNILCQEAWSDTDGGFAFTNLNKTCKFTVTGTDYNNVYNDIIIGNLTPI